MPRRQTSESSCQKPVATCCSALSDAEGAVMTLEVLASRLPYRPHANTLKRWTRKGLRGHLLRSFRVGHRVCVTERAWEEFQRATNQDAASSSAHAAAQAELDRLGV